MKYKEMRAKQLEDLKAGNADINIYRALSIPLTYIFIKLNIRPNTITIINFFLPVIGAVFMGFGSFLFVMIGMLVFMLSRVMDSNDGDVARILNQTSLEGFFFDKIGQVILDIFLGAGLGWGFYRFHNDPIYIFLGFAYLSMATIQFTMKLSLRTPYNNVDFIGKLTNKVFSKQNIFVRIAGIYPFQGFLYSDQFNILIILILIPAEFLFGFYFVGLYLLLISASKLIWGSCFIYNVRKSKCISKAYENR